MIVYVACTQMELHVQKNMWKVLNPLSNNTLNLPIGFSDKTLKWFHSYLTNKVIFVSLGTVFLEVGTINCGVHQGSILGPLLFLLCTNDILQALSNVHTNLYADEQVFFVKVRTLWKSKMFWIKNLRMYAIGLLIIRYQFILLEIKQNASFLIGIRSYLSLTQHTITIE